LQRSKRWIPHEHLRYLGETVEPPKAMSRRKTDPLRVGGDAAETSEPPHFRPTTSSEAEIGSGGSPGIIGQFLELGAGGQFILHVLTDQKTDAVFVMGPSSA
jgi:hypothetical protein